MEKMRAAESGQIEHVLSLSYGKDSLACIEAIKQLGLPLDRIVHAEVWATDTIPADLPEMVEFKKKADEIIFERYGLRVEHVCAMRDGEKLTYERQFYREVKTKDGQIKICGFPFQRGVWCNSRLKTSVLPKSTKETISYIGIAADEPERIVRHTKPNVVMPLVDIGWTEYDCLKWCRDNGLLSPIYQSASRGGVGSVTIKE